MPDTRRSMSSSFLLPLGDNGEKTRLNFWDRHSEAIPIELLEITGWIGKSPERWVVVPDGKNGTRAVQASELRPGDHSKHVLFRIPEDPRGRQTWEAYLFWLRLEQGRRRSAQAHVDAARRKAAAEDHALQERWDALYEETELARDAGRRAREDKTPELRRAATDELRAHVEECRAVASRWRVARRRAQDAHGVVNYWQAHMGAKSYPGLEAAINSFLDIQALSVASLASDEFRKRPPRRGTPPTEVNDRAEATTSVP